MGEPFLNYPEVNKALEMHAEDNQRIAASETN